jgi:hypothetical protein
MSLSSGLSAVLGLCPWTPGDGRTPPLNLIFPAVGGSEFRMTVRGISLLLLHAPEAGDQARSSDQA